MKLRNAVAALTLAAAAATPLLATEGPAAFYREPGQALKGTGRTLRNANGDDLSVAQAAGEKGTLVIFTCNGCPYVKAWEDRIAALGNEFRAKGVGVIAINANDSSRYPDESLEAMRVRAREKKIRFPYVIDDTSDLARAFGATRTPEVFLFDGEGSLVYHGAVDDNARDPSAVKATWLRDALNALLAGDEIPVTSTKALGCGIKFRPEG